VMNWFYQLQRMNAKPFSGEQNNFSAFCNVYKRSIKKNFCRFMIKIQK
jgi:hypothetical protein